MSRQVQQEIEQKLREACKSFIGEKVTPATLDSVRTTLKDQLLSLQKARLIKIVPRFELRHPTVFDKSEDRWVEDKRQVEVVWNEDDLEKAGIRD